MSYKAKCRNGMKGVVTYIDPFTKMCLKDISQTQETTINLLVKEAVQDLVVKYAKLYKRQKNVRVHCKPG